VRDLNETAIRFRSRQDLSARLPYLRPSISVKALGPGLKNGDGIAGRETGSNADTKILSPKFAPTAKKLPGQVLKLHVSYDELKSNPNGPHWGWVDPPKQLSAAEKKDNYNKALAWKAKQPKVVINYFKYNADGSVESEPSKKVRLKSLGPTVGSMNPSGRIDLHGPIGMGVVIDANGKMRCPPGTPNANQFTDADMSNCMTVGPMSLMQDIRRFGGWLDRVRADRDAILAGYDNAAHQRLVEEERMTQDAARRLNNAKGNYTSLARNAEIWSERATKINSLLTDLGITGGPHDSALHNMDYIAALEILHANHDGPEFRNLFNDAEGFEWDDTLTAAQNLQKYDAAINETLIKGLGIEALLNSPNQQEADDARQALEWVKSRHSLSQRGMLGSYLQHWQENPEAAKTVAHLQFLDPPDGDELADYWGTHAL
jgi:hypothetical protein